MSRPLEGRRIGGCSVERLLGAGASGLEVYRGDHPLHGAVDLQVCRLTGGTLDEANLPPLERFARVGVAVRSDHVVRVHGLEIIELAELGTLAVLVSDAVDGPDLLDLVRRDGPIAAAAAARLAAGIARGLAAIHDAGWVHEALTPLAVHAAESGERAVVVELAHARRIGERPDPERGRIMGAPLYLAPEAINDATPDPRTDIYALGRILRGMLAGVWPHAGSALETLKALAQGRRPPDPPLPPGAPAELVAVADRLAAPDRADRPDSAATAAELIEEAAGLA